MEEIKKSLECSICLNVATLPVHPVCCLSSRSMPPGCLSCVRNYFQLNKPIRYRQNEMKGWNGCGCTVDTHAIGSSAYYKHSFELDNIRNIIGKSICYHEDCNAEFSTCAELRRHLNGSATKDDIHGNCQEAFTRCNYCNYHGKRRQVEGEHFDNFHFSILCNICNRNVFKKNLQNHYEAHLLQLKEFGDTLIYYNII